MNPLDLIPGARWVHVAIAAAVVGLVGAAFLVQHGQIQSLRVKLSAEQTGRAQDREAYAAAALKASTEYRAEEQRRAAEQQEKIDAAEQKLVQERADRAVADAAAGRLSQRVAALVAAAREAARNPQAVQPGAAADDPAGMLADVLGRCVQRVRLLATLADERGTAGQLCEQSYDALTP